MSKYHNPNVSLSMATKSTVNQKRTNLIKESAFNSNTYEGNGSLNSKYRHLSNQAGLNFNDVTK